MKISSYISWTMLVVTFILATLVGFVVYQVGEQKDSHKRLIVSAQERAVKDASLVKLRALLNETKKEREAFASTIPTDVLLVVDLLDAVGNIADVDVKISNAQPLGAANERAGVTSVAFVLQADGSFAQLTRIAELLGSLPAASVIDSLELWRDDGDQDWHLTTRIRFLIAAPISS